MSIEEDISVKILNNPFKKKLVLFYCVLQTSNLIKKRILGQIFDQSQPKFHQ